MNIDSVLKKEGIIVKSKLEKKQVNKIASIISRKIVKTFPEHNLKIEDLFNCLSRLDMYIAQMPDNSAVAKYFYKNNSIYFSNRMNLNNLDTLVIHECIHAIQEIKSPKGKLLKLGLYNLSTNKGQGINEAAVQLMASKASDSKNDYVKYYNLNFNTESPLYYPIETALVNQIIYFTGSYPLFHSTLHSNNIFKNTFIAKTSKKIYDTIEKNFDLLLHYEELLSICLIEMEHYSESDASLKKVNRLNQKINNIKNMIFNITLSTQNIILENCFLSEFEFIKDLDSLNEFQTKIYNFSNLLINTENYNFYNQFYCEMMNKLEEKRKLIKTHGTLTYLNDLQTDLLDLERETFGFSFFYRLFDKLKLLFEEALRDKENN